MFQFCFVFYMGEGHSAVTKVVKTVTFYGWKYRHYFVVAVTVMHLSIVNPIGYPGYREWLGL